MLSERENNPALTYKVDENYSMLEIYVDGELFSEWYNEGFAEDQFLEFKRIFMAGLNYPSFSGTVTREPVK